MKENMDFIRSNESGASVDKSEKVQGSEMTRR